MEEMAVHTAEIANPIGQLETNFVAERTARLDVRADTDVIDQKTEAADARSVGKFDRHEGVGSLGQA